MLSFFLPLLPLFSTLLYFFHVFSLSCFCLPSLTLLTTSTERPQPPRKLSVPQDGVESRCVRLHWVTGGSGSSPLRYFTLQVKELPSGDWNAHTADIPHNVTTWIADRYTYAHMYRHTHRHTHICLCGDSVVHFECQLTVHLTLLPNRIV